MPIAPQGGVTASSATAVSSLALPIIAGALSAAHDAVVGVVIGSASATVSSITDTMSNVYRPRVGVTNSAGIRSEIWEAQSWIPGSILTVTVNLSASAPVSAALYQYSGVTVEAIPTPQLTTSAQLTSSQIDAGANVSAISSWSVAVFGYASTDSATNLAVVRGIVRASAAPATGGVGIVLLDIQPYASPAGFSIASQMANIQEGTATVIQPWAGVTLELRSATGGSGGTGPGDTGGPTPPLPPWEPGGATGTLVTWSYTYTVPSPSTFAPAIAQVTCHYLGGTCPRPPAGEGGKGNQAY